MGRNSSRAPSEPLAQWYTPAIDGNRDDPEPFRVHLMPMSAGEFETAQETHLGADFTAATEAKKQTVMSRSNVLRDALIAKYCIAVENYTETLPDGSRCPVNDGVGLVVACKRSDNPSECIVLDEIQLALRNRSVLEAGLKKASKPRSGPSTQSETSGPDNGAARGAVEPSNPALTSQRINDGPSGVATATPTDPFSINGTRS